MTIEQLMELIQESLDNNRTEHALTFCKVLSVALEVQAEKDAHEAMKTALYGDNQ